MGENPTTAFVPIHTSNWSFDEYVCSLFTRITKYLASFIVDLLFPSFVDFFDFYFDFFAYSNNTRLITPAAGRMKTVQYNAISPRGEMVRVVVTDTMRPGSKEKKRFFSCLFRSAFTRFIRRNIDTIPIRKQNGTNIYMPTTEIIGAIFIGNWAIFSSIWLMLRVYGTGDGVY